MEKSRRSFLGRAAAILGASLTMARSDIGFAAPEVGRRTEVLTDSIWLPERVIPLPRSVCKAAQAYLLRLSKQPKETIPAITDKAGWHLYIEEHDTRAFPKGIPDELPEAGVETRVIGGTTVYVAARGARTPPCANPKSRSMVVASRI